MGTVCSHALTTDVVTTATIVDAEFALHTGYSILQIAATIVDAEFELHTGYSILQIAPSDCKSVFEAVRMLKRRCTLCGHGCSNSRSSLVKS